MRVKTLRRIRRAQEGLKLLWESDEKRIRRKHRQALGREPDLVRPRTFNEKVLWLNLHDRDPLRTVCADKYAVRDWVAGRIGERYLVPLLGVYDDVEQIELERLPSGFVIKATHGSGWNLIVSDKSRLDWQEARATLRDWLSRSYYPYMRERQYRAIPPRLVVEELLEDADGSIPADFKFLCLAGSREQTLIVGVDLDRQTDHRRNLYDLEWKRLPVEFTYPASDRNVPKPERFDEMADVARRLSEGFPLVRVDLYCTPRGVFFGELTFTPDAGNGRFTPPEWDRRLGDLVQLPNCESV